MTDAPLQVGLLGVGTVGGSVARILQEQSERIAHRAGRPIVIRRAVVRDLQKPRDIELPDGVLTDDPQRVIDDPEIDVVLQLMGGIHPAKEVLESLLQAGKHVVTANKALLCDHGEELFRLARKVDRCIAFEAAVAGGIPIISAVGQALAANQITSLQAILNGTSNFILTQMLSQNRAYSEALAEAQELGYAEADPTMDVDGTDAAQKLVILTQLAFGTRVPLESFPRQGIDSLELADLQFAAELGYIVKLLAVAKLVDNHLELHVQPTLVHKAKPLANVEGPFNMIAVEGDAVGRTWFSGPGAGGMATASAVVADLIDIAVGRAQLTFSHLDLWQQREPIPLQSENDIARRYYLRLNIEDRPHVIADIADALGKQEISIASVIQHETPEVEIETTSQYNIVPLVIMTHRTTEGKIRAANQKIEQLECLRLPGICLPVAD